ncbi:hypothetical protein GYMLUDRAFT_63754 [Collybiopsis luxurians FD-317 M1]|uniref:Unplaced genomic scaffold GYMLUscaffold_82, whole genome shotgun sequence n=1 Tax=Collybiopsis luxurians FD-317 M1 TaxID=944289 RepID=A0A0D0BFC8_9AGAR|nr:hypothetical protein GYMLUDRAFT_63754 [Collybiopsis luxurians FD-317 M1]
MPGDSEFNVHFMLFSADYCLVTQEVNKISFNLPMPTCHVHHQMAHKLHQFVTHCSNLGLIQLPTHNHFMQLLDLISMKQPTKIVAFLAIKAPKGSQLPNVLAEEAYFVTVLGMGRGLSH